MEEPYFSGEYRITLPIFDGPFDLLLYLIKVNEMDIYDISISTITAQYLDYIQTMQQLNLDIAGDFLVMAATLIRLKAQQLLPTMQEIDKDEEIDEILSTRDLIQQLIEYRRIKEMAGELQERQDFFSRIFYRSQTAGSHVIEPEEPNEDKENLRLDLQTLFYAFSRVLPYVEAGKITHIIPERFNVQEKILQIVEALQQQRSIEFLILVQNCRFREELIVTFLALMELCRRRMIVIEQEQLFGDISISLKSEQHQISEQDTEVSSIQDTVIDDELFNQKGTDQHGEEKENNENKTEEIN